MKPMVSMIDSPSLMRFLPDRFRFGRLGQFEWIVMQLASNLSSFCESAQHSPSGFGGASDGGNGIGD